MTTALIILAIQTILGALDNVLHHEITERLPGRPSARRELALHSGREGIYGILFLVFAWSEPTGLLAAGVLALLLVEVAITVADFVEEDRTRRLPPFERVLHTVLTVTYGAFLAFALPWLIANAAKATGVTLVSHGFLSWFFTLSSIGVLAFAVRNVIAVRRLSKSRTAAASAVPSGRSVLVTGATGFIGSALVERLLARGDRVFVLTRDARQSRALFGDSVLHVEDLRLLPPETHVDAVVNLAGAPILGLPWTRGRRDRIRRSRIDLTERLVDWMKRLERKPSVLVGGSAIGIYGDRADQILAENEAAGRGFGADLCREWEQAAARATELDVRVVQLRIGLVLDKAGGPLPLMALPARLGLGAILGTGRQWMSWIARGDLVRMIVAAVDDARWQGPVNAVAPEPLRHADFQRALARTLRRPLFLQAPRWMLKTLLGEMSSIFLFSQRVVPSKAACLGFAFDVCWAADALSLELGAPPAPLPATALRPAAPLEQTVPPATGIVREVHDDHPARGRPVAARAQSALRAG